MVTTVTDTYKQHTNICSLAKVAMGDNVLGYHEEIVQIDFMMHFTW